MDIIDALHKLGFSFWQVIVLIILFVYRKPLTELIASIVRIKIADKEVEFQGNREAVSQLLDLKDKVQSQPSVQPKDLLTSIDSKLEKLYVDSLRRIRKETKFLYPVLRVLDTENSAVAEIMASTYERIREDLATLEEARLIQVNVEDVFESRWSGTVMKVRLTRLDSRISELAKKSEAL